MQRQMSIGIGRRGLMRAVAGAAAVGVGASIAPKAAKAQTASDIDLLNLMLNVEYLVVQYSCAAANVAVSLARLTAGSAPGVPAQGGRRVTFTDSLLASMASEMANDNHNHLVPMRTVIGALAAGQPALDIAAGPTNAFSVAMQRAGVVAAGATFDPYASEENFLYTMFLLKGITVSAYRGLTALVSNRVVVQNFTGLLGTECVHAAVIRSYLYSRGATTQRIRDNADKIAAFQRSLNGGQAFQGVAPANRTYPGGTAAVRVANISTADGSADVPGRSAGQVLNQLYLTNGAATSGGFFPQGVNGTIRTSAAA